jgi:hypothetical protein
MLYGVYTGKIMDNDVKKILFAKTEKSYGASYKEHCLEIYKMYVERADAISSRRESANTFFLSVNTVLIGLVGYLDTSQECAKLAIGVAGILLCYFWYRLLLSYKGLNTAKFQVIHEIEKKLALSPYDAEWEFLGRGKNSDCYKPFTHIEIWVPRIFLYLHLFAILFTYWDRISLILLS